jgi:hypothetical protein
MQEALSTWLGSLIPEKANDAGAAAGLSRIKKRNYHFRNNVSASSSTDQATSRLSAANPKAE